MVSKASQVKSKVQSKGLGAYVHQARRQTKHRQRQQQQQARLRLGTTVVAAIPLGDGSGDENKGESFADTLGDNLRKSFDYELKKSIGGKVSSRSLLFSFFSLFSLFFPPPLLSSSSSSSSSLTLIFSPSSSELDRYVDTSGIRSDKPIESLTPEENKLLDVWTKAPIVGGVAVVGLLFLFIFVIGPPPQHV